MHPAVELAGQLPRALTSYPSSDGASLIQLLLDRARLEPFNAVATAIFVVAILHTFAAARFTRWADRIQEAADARAVESGEPARPSVAAEALHFFGEVEVVFGLWAVVLFGAMAAYSGFAATRHYFNETVNYTEPVFVVVVMALASTRPIVGFAEAALRRVANLGRGTPASWWMSILIIGPLLGSFITEPAAMTICALLLARQFYDRQPGARLKYATLGLLFVNVSIGGTLTHFAAPPVLMVARVWDWDLPFMLSHLGWRAAVAITASTFVYWVIFRRELRDLTHVRPVVAGGLKAAGRGGLKPVGYKDESESLLPVPQWLTAAHIGFMAWTVFTAHYPALFVGGFLLFLGFTKATSAYQEGIDLRAPILVGFFLAGLVIHGGLQGWWIAPILGRLHDLPLYLSATVLTGFNDNALITYLATLVPDLSDTLKIAVVSGAVTGGGLTVIANAPNPAGQALLSRFFGGAVAPLNLFLGALLPTVIAILAFRLL